MNDDKVDFAYLDTGRFVAFTLGERNILAADFEMVVKYECVLRRSHAARGARPDQVHLTVRKLSGLDHRCSEAAEERGVGWFGS